jgi:hypothetical protein
VRIASWTKLLSAGGLIAGLTGAHAASTSETIALADEQLQEIIIRTPEARYVSSTRRDRIGRIWAPVMINDQGPFKLVLDSGATSSAVMLSVAEQLGADLNKEAPVQLLGVTGRATVPTIRVDSLVIGDLQLSGQRLPIVLDAMGGAEGVLGSEGLLDMRVHIDFRADTISITRSREQKAPAGFLAVPLDLTRKRLPVVDAIMGGVKVKAVINTGGQASIGNNALRDALLKRRLPQAPTVDTITGATADVQLGQGYPAPPIEIGDLVIRYVKVTFGEMKIFGHWGMTDQPTIMVGMDTLGQLDTLIIDYKLSQMQIRVPSKPIR